MKDKDTINVLIPPALPTVDHGIDIIGDELDEEDVEIENPETEYEEKYVPEHPYCTNWPVSKKEKKDENI